jgi:hypothetical protein
MNIIKKEKKKNVPGGIVTRNNLAKGHIDLNQLHIAHRAKRKCPQSSSLKV